MAPHGSLDGLSQEKPSETRGRQEKGGGGHVSWAGTWFVRVHGDKAGGQGGVVGIGPLHGQNI